MNCLIHTLQPLCGWMLWMNMLRLRGLGWIAPPIPLPPSAGYETVCGHDKLAGSTHPPSFILSPRYYFWREKKGNIIIYVYDKTKLFLHGWVAFSEVTGTPCPLYEAAKLKAASFRALVFTANASTCFELSECFTFFFLPFFFFGFSRQSFSV